MRNLSLGSVTPESFARYWQHFIATDYRLYIESLIEYANLTNLNDWGIYMLVTKTAKLLFSDLNSQNMWTWAMLNQAGYQIKIGYLKNQTYLLLPTLQSVYEKAYYSIEGSNYYVMNSVPDDKKIYTYTESFDGATKKIDLHLSRSLNFGQGGTVTKNTVLPGQTETISLKLDKTTIGFLASYPQTENAVYLNAAFSQSIQETLYESIAKDIQGMTEEESVSYLLKYLHTAFEYKTDDEQFGKEKMFFPDEIFYYPYSDCEDRTVLFTKLVAALVGIDVVGVSYPGHMAAAVAFTRPVEGAGFLVDGLDFTICDPTYLNAPIGSVMPKYRSTSPRAIKIFSNYKTGNNWHVIAQHIEKGNEGKIFISDKSITERGNYIVSGWYKDQISINGKTHKASGATRDLWFARFDEKGDLDWFMPIQCSGFGFVKAFAVGQKGNVYALINYNGSIAVNETQLCSSEETAHLMLGISNRAKVIIKENIILEAAEGEKIAFLGRFKPDGTKIELFSFPTEKVTFESDIAIDSRNDVVVRGMVGEIEGLTKEVPVTHAGVAFSAENQIESYLDEYKAKAFHKQMAGLFATIKLLSQNGGSISGTVVQRLLSKNNPEFSEKNPAIFKSLMRMMFVVNNGGIILIQTRNGKKISLAAMKIENNSNMQIVKTSESSYKLKFLNGVEVGKAIVWYDLNFISMRSNGELIFDYDDDHTKKEVAISEIVEL